MKSRHLTYIEDGLLVGQTGPWAFGRLDMDAYDFRSPEGKVHLARSEARQLENLEGYECQLISVPRVYSVDTWSEQLAARTPNPAPGFRPYMNAVSRYLKEGGGDPNIYLNTLSVQLRGHQLSQREVYLGVKVGGRGRMDMLRNLFRPADRAMGLEDPRPSEKDLDEWRREASEVFDKLSNLKPATAAELRWLMSRTQRRGLGDEPDIPSREAWGGDARALVDGLVQNGRRWVQMEPPDGSYVAVLTVAYMPPSQIPGGEWLARCDKLPFPVEASVRFEVVTPEEAVKRVRSKIDAALDMERHIRGTSQRLPVSLRESIEGAQELEYQITKGQRPLVESWPRFLVWGATKAELESRVTQLTAFYRRHRIELERPAGDQLTLFHETVPGASTRSPFYKQTIPVETLAGGMYVASTDLGDGVGCYQGISAASGNVPVFTDIFLPAEQDMPTTFVFTGRPGSGKTSTAKLLAYQARLRGAWVVVLDPKGEFEPLTNLPGIGRHTYIRLDERYAGLLDPFRFETSRGRATLLAVDLCRQFLPPVTPHVEGELLLAAEAEAQDSLRPSMQGVIRRLEGAEDAEAAKAGQLLRTVARQPLANMCFASERTADLEMEDALTVLSFVGLDIPDEETPREDYNVEDRLAVGLVSAVTALLRVMIDKAPPNVPKLVEMDEAWMVTGSSQGRRLTEKLARTGRSKYTALVLVSQNAADFLGTQITNNIVGKYCFHSEDKNEIRQLCELLGLEFTDEYVELFQGLPSGWCVHQDIYGRVGLLVVDRVLRYLERATNTTAGQAEETEVVGAGVGE